MAAHLMSRQCNGMTVEAEPQSDQDVERRITLHALKTWTDAWKGEKMPELSDLAGEKKLAGTQQIFTDNQFLILFDTHLNNSVVLFYGSKLPKAVGPRHMGSSLQGFLPTALSRVFSDAIMKAVNNDTVVNRDGTINTKCGASLLYRSIFMPLRLGEDHPNCTYVFGAFSHQRSDSEHISAA